MAAVGLSPLSGQIDPKIGPLLLPGVAVAVGVVWFGPRAVRRLPWRWLLAASFATASAWAVLLALSDGPSALTQPLTSRYDYLHDLPLVQSPAAFLATFVDRIGSFATHVRGHPPGVLLLLWSLDRAGLAGPGWAAAVFIGLGATSVPAALIALRDVAGTDRARAAAPFLALLPAAVWMATSADALFTGVTAWAVTCFVLATSSSGGRSDSLALVGGLLFGAALFLTYGAVLVAAVPLAVTIVRRRFRPLLLASVGSAVVVAAFALAGFWWLEGARATAREVHLSSMHRAYLPFLLFNLGMFAIALGPAIAGGMVQLRDRGVLLLPAGALAAILVADVSGLSKGEVERIWLPFVPWVAASAAGLASVRPEVASTWLAAQASVAVAVQILVRSPW